MPKIRTIKPEFWTSEDVVKCGPLARLFFIGLWTFCDDAGVFKWAPLSLKMLVFPNDPIDTLPLLEELLAAGLIAKEEHDGQCYGRIVNFARHQKIDSRYFKAVLPQDKPARPTPDESVPPPPDANDPGPTSDPAAEQGNPGDTPGPHGTTRGPDTGGGSGSGGGSGNHPPDEPGGSIAIASPAAKRRRRTKGNKPIPEHLQALAVFTICIKPRFDNVQQIGGWVSRNLRASKRLVGYSPRQVATAYAYAVFKRDEYEKQRGAGYDVTLETVEKKIVEHKDDQPGGRFEREIQTVVGFYEANKDKILSKDSPFLARP